MKPILINAGVTSCDAFVFFLFSFFQANCKKQSTASKEQAWSGSRHERKVKKSQLGPPAVFRITCGRIFSFVLKDHSRTLLQGFWRIIRSRSTNGYVRSTWTRHIRFSRVTHDERAWQTSYCSTRDNARENFNLVSFYNFYAKNKLRSPYSYSFYLTSEKKKLKIARQIPRRRKAIEKAFVQYLSRFPRDNIYCRVGYAISIVK